MGKEENKQYQKEYYQSNKERLKKYYQKYRENHKTESEEYGKKYRKSLKGKKYYQSAEGKEVRKKAYKKYHQTPKGKEVSKKYQKKYYQTPEGKEVFKKARKKYRQTPNGKEIIRKGRKIDKAKRKHFGFIPLNEPFEGCEGHHINTERVIYIPKEIHRNVWHSNFSGVGMDKINRLAFEYLKIENEAKRGVIDKLSITEFVL